ncbi:Chromo domain protein [Pseudocohnilembus persalinus]|uniref:Chromo domain protein n=1 Tax=Pseudocohnilembus persalinus TaxID=266149 RepID=A0A0V0QH07_PSEPJ|nr:Chromo domain protein [Pseudocohnilembus persalinus]|eukprot:KRX01479.1 Chromo domain protein [Pseudocohnilembus persalinus]
MRTYQNKKPPKSIKKQSSLKSLKRQISSKNPKKQKNSVKTTLKGKKQTKINPEFQKIDRIIKKEIFNQKYRYQVRWQGYGPEDDTWVNSKQFQGNLPEQDEVSCAIAYLEESLYGIFKDRDRISNDIFEKINMLMNAESKVKENEQKIQKKQKLNLKRKYSEMEDLMENSQAFVHKKFKSERLQQKNKNKNINLQIYIDQKNKHKLEKVPKNEINNLQQNENEVYNVWKQNIANNHQNFPPKSKEKLSEEFQKNKQQYKDAYQQIFPKWWQKMYQIAENQSNQQKQIDKQQNISQIATQTKSNQKQLLKNSQQCEVGQDKQAFKKVHNLHKKNKGKIDHQDSIFRLISIISMHLVEIIIQ